MFYGGETLSIKKQLSAVTLILLFVVFNFAVDGKFLEWRTWNISSVSCSQGVKRRTRTCTNLSPFKGANCTGNYTEHKVSNEGQCPGAVMFYDSG